MNDVIVIGGGQAGLAAGHFLARKNLTFVILDAADEPAAAWRSRWDSLRLFTPARFDALPGRPFPGDPDRYPTRDEVVEYLTGYASELPVEYGARVTRLTATEGGYRVELADRTLEAAQVIVATGPFQAPRTPTLAQAVSGDVLQLHSSHYRNPAQIADGPVLVVGGGNTGHQIAEELSATHEVHLSVGSRQSPLPQRVLGIDLFRILDRLGAMRKTVDSRIGRKMKDRELLIGSSPRRARRRGIVLHDRTTAAEGGVIRFADGATLRPATIIWATGFTRDHSWIDVPVFDAAGAPVHERGVTAAPGLFFLGLPWQHTRGSALLGWVSDDAAYIAARVGPAVRTVIQMTAQDPGRLSD